jgi:hypothetical protein
MQLQFAKLYGEWNQYAQRHREFEAQKTVESTMSCMQLFFKPAWKNAEVILGWATAYLKTTNVAIEELCTGRGPSRWCSLPD